MYRSGGHHRKEAPGTLAEARAIKLVRDAEARAERRGPTLHAFALGWLERYAGSGHDSVRENTRREYRRLLVTFAIPAVSWRGAGPTAPPASPLRTPEAPRR
jgi:hypothetical protein